MNKKMSDQWDIYQLIINRWLWLLVAGLCGAVMGWCLFISRAPVYESSAILGVNINYLVTQPLELVVENRAISAIAQTILSDEVVGQVIAEMNAAGSMKSMTIADFREHASLSRRLSDWYLLVRAEDPEWATMLAENWARVSLEFIHEAQEHGWRVVALMNEQQFDLECERVPAESLNYVCTTLPLHLEGEAYQGAIQNELILSRGILPGINVTILQEPIVPTEPILWGKTTLIVAGAMAGLIAGFIAVFFGPLKKNKTQSDGVDDVS